jgi:hypothetical protein
MKTVRLSDLLTEDEVINLRMFVTVNMDGIPRVKDRVLAWIRQRPEVMEKLNKHALLHEYAAWMFAYYLGL